MKKKVVILSVVLIIIIVLLFLIGKSLFASTDSSRIKETDNYSLTKKEKESVIEKLEEIENVSSVKIYTNIKIIKIMVNLDEDTDFEQVKKISNESLELISEDNLEYFDVEIYVSSKNKDSEIYPQIGYKHKLKSEFAW